jgi:hypothetical protein
MLEKPKSMKKSKKRIASLFSSMTLVAGMVACATQAQCASTGTQPAATETHPPIPIQFTLKKAGFVTLVIEDASGHRVRNLISETPFPAGQSTAWWDGLDDVGRDLDAAEHAVFHIPGKLVAAGQYRVRGLVRPSVNLSYKSTPYTNGQPPWNTKDRSSQWLANHTAPNTVLFVPPGAAPVRPGKPTSAGGQVLVGSFVSEGGSGLAWLDMNGRKLNGQVWLGGVWTAASHLARDEGDKPVPGVYAYAGAGWKGDKYNDNVAELRLHELVATPAKKGPSDTRMGNGEDRAVLTPTFKIPAATPAADNIEAEASGDKNPLGGLAVHNGLLVASLPWNGLLLFVDAAAHKALGAAKLNNPGGLAFDRQGRLLVISGTKILRFQLAADPTQLPAPQTLIGSGLEDPQQIAHDAQGNLYISDWGKSHQVKVFSHEGQFVRTIGKAGAPTIGTYDPNHMNHPNGLSLDDQGRLWVAETDKTPKRVSVWAPDGKLASAFYGPAAYGGGGWLDTEDKTRFFYSDEGGAMELKIDPDTGASVPVTIYYRPQLDTLGLKGKYTGVGPQTPLHVDGRTYFTNAYNSNPTGGAASAQIWRMENGIVKPVASIGKVSDSSGEVLRAFQGDEFKAPIAALNAAKGEILFAWSDRNGDGKIQPEETTFLKPTRPTFQNQTLIGGVSVQPDLSVVVAYVGDQAMRFVPQGFTPTGAPIYDANKGEVLASGVQRQSSSGGGQALTAKNGWTVLTTAPKPFASQGFGGVKNGEALWSYPSLWPGLHASHHAPMPDAPGQVIGSTRLLGNTVTPLNSDAGELWAINGNKGNIYLFTMDGLLVATLFKDSRTASWDFPEARPGMSVNDTSSGEENFWPSISQTSDGGIYLQTNGNIVKVDGLEGVQRLPDSGLNVTLAQLQQSQDYFAQLEAARQAAKASGALTISLLPTAPVVDGKLADWAGANWVTIDTRMTQVGNWGRRTIKTEAALAVSGDRLYAAFRTDDAKLLNNSGESLQNLFKTGGGLDLMIGTNPNSDSKRTRAVAGDERLFVTQIKGRTTAMLYRPIVPGDKTEPVQFASPLRTLKMDRVDNVSDAVTLALGSETDEKTKLVAGFFEFSIPLATLGLEPKANMTLKGDIGILRGNGFQTLQRVYWSNKATGLVSDLPSEAELTPQLWGTIEVR